MDWSLAMTALIMGLMGGPHCLAMCGAACAALGGGPAQTRVMTWHSPASLRRRRLERLGLGQASSRFLLGRLVGYACLGALACGSVQALGWLGTQSAALRPLWTLMHVAAGMLGLVLLWQARQPAWLEEGGLRLWRGLQSSLCRAGGTGGLRAAPWVMGLAWGLMPCGLLYSALLVAALSPGLWQGATVMLLFALGSSLGLMLGPWLRRWLRGVGDGAWAVRLAGACLLTLSAWALWMGLWHDAAPWCLAASTGG